MKIGWGLLWALALAIMLAPFSKADVCQRGAEKNRIKVLPADEGRVKFVWCSGSGKNPCVPIGPKDQTFTLEQLSKERDEIHSAKAGASAGSTAGGIMSIFFLSIGDIGDMGTASNGSEKEHQKELRLAAELKTLAPELLTTDEACHDVGSLTSHKATLARILTRIYKAELAKQEIAPEKLEDTQGDKYIKSSPKDDSPKSTAPVASGGQKKAG